VKLKFPNAPGLVRCLNILVSLCPGTLGGGPPAGTVNDYLGALTATSKCLIRLAQLNFNYVDPGSYGNVNGVEEKGLMGGGWNGGGGGGGGGGRGGPRLLQQLLGGLGNALDNLLKDLLGTGAQPGGGLLGQILG